MTVLAALARAYNRMEDPPPFGYSLEKIGCVIGLNEDGSVASVVDIRTDDGAKRLPVPMIVPQPTKRTAGIFPNFLWDKTSYVLGVTAGAGKRVAEEHAVFVEKHEEMLSGTNDSGLRALSFFLKAWSPDQFVEPMWPDAMKDMNVVFSLESERLQNIWLHDRSAAKTIWSAQLAARDSKGGLCLVTGAPGSIARVHPAIKGVWGGQPSGGSIVTFNEAAYESYGHKQGDNAPVSEQAAFAYTTALNQFLAKGSRNRIQVGDASTVFWADAKDAQASTHAEGAFWAMFGGDIDETRQAERVGEILSKVRSGQPLTDFAPNLAKGVLFYVLGLAPNAARLSIRFWYESDFADLASKYTRYVEEMRIDPVGSDPYPPFWKYLLETAVLGKGKNVPPNLAGDWMRAILSGTRYPQALLTTVLMRIRADKTINVPRVAMLKALLIRNFNRKETPVALDPDFHDRGYLLGRLFAVYERVQTAALGGNVNATIKDKFYGAASAQPCKVFALIDRNSAHHLSKLAKRSIGQKVNLEKDITKIMGLMSPADDPFPTSLTTEQQALFGLGYYHQRETFFQSKDKPQQETVQ